MALFSPHVIHPASAPSSQPWITLTSTWQQLLKIPHTLRPSMLPLLLESKCWTNIMIRLTTPRFIGLQWVSHLIFNFIFDSNYNSLVLHPCHKLHYFKKARWEDDWINTAQDIVQTDQTYAFMDIDIPETETCSTVVSFFLSTLLFVTDSFDDPPSTSSSENIFDNLPALSAPPKTDLCDKLDCYLSTDPEHVTHALTWWHKNRCVYPCLHHMALDYLTIPGEFYLLSDSSWLLLLATSVDVEQVFSQGWLLLSHVWSHLSI